MNKTLWIVLALGVIVIAGGAFLYTQKATAPGTTDGDAMEEAMEKEDNAMMESMEKEEGDAMEQTEAMESEGKTTYAISNESTATYVVQKGWLDKASEEVTGVTNQVSGTISTQALETGYQLMVDATIAAEFDSGASGRDTHVAGLFNGPIVVRLDQEVTADLSVEGTYEETVALAVTMNGTTQTLSVPVTLTVAGESVTASGSADFAMTSFGIEPPSIVGVYNVADDMSIAFAIQAS